MSEDWLMWLGSMLAHHLSGGRMRLLLYIEMMEGCSAGCVYIDEGNAIAEVSVDRAFWSKIYDDWHELSDGQRWAVMQFSLAADGAFKASFRFPDEVDVTDVDTEWDRKTAAARAAFGEKPIRCMPLPSTAFDLTHDPHGLDTPLG